MGCEVHTVKIGLQEVKKKRSAAHSILCSLMIMMITLQENSDISEKNRTQKHRSRRRILRTKFIYIFFFSVLPSFYFSSLVEMR